MSRNVHDLIGDISEMLDTVECEYINVSEDRDYLQRELKEFKEKDKELPKAYDLGYEEGFAKGEQSMQEKANKICEYWENNNTSVLIELFDGWTWTQIFENIEKSYNKIIEYEKKKEQEEKEIHVGDEVVDKNGKKYVVRHLVGVFMYAMSSSGSSYTFSYSDVSKTGKHYPLEEMLKELE